MGGTVLVHPKMTIIFEAVLSLCMDRGIGGSRTRIYRFTLLDDIRTSSNVSKNACKMLTFSYSFFSSYSFLLYVASHLLISCRP